MIKNKPNKSTCSDCCKANWVLQGDVGKYWAKCSECFKPCTPVQVNSHKIEEIGIDISQWKNYGQKFGYWDYFRGEIRKELANELLEKGHGGGNFRQILLQIIE